MCKYRNRYSELIEMNAPCTDSFVSTVSRPWTVRSWVQFLAEEWDYYLQDFLRLALGPNRSLLLLDARVLSLGLKCIVCKVDCPLTSNANGKNEWSCTSPSPTCLHGLHRDQFYLYHTELICCLTNFLKGILLTVWSILTWHWQFL
jgi:hypothetical protein